MVFKLCVSRNGRMCTYVDWDTATCVVVWEEAEKAVLVALEDSLEVLEANKLEASLEMDDSVVALTSSGFAALTPLLLVIFWTLGEDARLPFLKEIKGH